MQPPFCKQERKRLLSFVVVGGGPTGVEVAAELYDMIHDDLRWVHSGAAGSTCAAGHTDGVLAEGEGRAWLWGPWNGKPSSQAP